MTVGDTVRVKGPSDQYQGQVGRIVKMDDHFRVATVKSPTSDYTFSISVDFLEYYEYDDDEFV